MAAAKKEALKRPKAKSQVAYLPASGSSAWAAWPAVSTVTPAVWRVAAQATTMAKATTSVTTQPAMTSRRDIPYCSGLMPFSTTAACR